MSLKKPVICVAEDNQVMLDRLVEVLSLQYSVIPAINGFQAFQLVKVKDNVPDLIITDIMMPELDGMQLLKFLQSDEQYRNIPVIMFTALNDEDTMVSAYDNGAVDYIIKPFSMKVLLAKVHRLLRKNTVEVKLEDLSANDSLVARVDAYITENISNPDIYISEISKHIHLSTQQLHRRLLKLTGKTISAYILMHRLEHARNLIVMKALSINEIAYQSGFRSPSYFIKMFKRQYTITPLEMRQIIGNGSR